MTVYGSVLRGLSTDCVLNLSGKELLISAVPGSLHFFAIQQVQSIAFSDLTEDFVRAGFTVWGGSAR